MFASETLKDIQEVYCSDSTPWVVGYSGGKDSTALLQFIFYALSKLPRKKLKKEIHVISNDTCVENPVVLSYVDDQLCKIEAAGKSTLFGHNPDLFKVVKTVPKLEERFWVNLIAKGYPSPNRWFRWCTERLKINPTNDYVGRAVCESGKVIIVLGTRRAESANRAAAMKHYDNGGKLRAHRTPNAYVYTPIADLENHEVWAYLLQAASPWGGDNKELFALYQGASDNGECPFVIETGTPSCGKSRFGCWVCTVIDRDKAMENYIENGDEWLEPLLEFRNMLYKIRQASYQYIPNRVKSKVKFGPFLIRTRRELLNGLLAIQEKLADRLGTRLIREDEYDYLMKVFKNESRSANGGGVLRYEFTLSDRRRFAAVADFDVLDTPRQRLGPLHLNNAIRKKVKTVTKKYDALSRVLYYEV